jgi:hypothetical protein
MGRQQEDVLGPVVVILLTDNWCVSTSSCAGIVRPASRVVNVSSSTGGIVLDAPPTGGCARADGGHPVDRQLVCVQVLLRRHRPPRITRHAS